MYSIFIHLIDDNKSILYHVNDGLFGCFCIDMVLQSINCQKEDRNPFLCTPLVSITYLQTVLSYSHIITSTYKFMHTSTHKHVYT